MPSTTDAEPPRRGLAVLLGAAALLLFALALPRGIAALVERDGREALRASFSTTQPSEAQLAAGAAAFDSAAGWSADGEREGARSLLLLQQALLAEGAARTALLRAAEDSAIAALRRAPAQPGVWNRLALLREQSGDRIGAVAALRMSFLSGPFVPALNEPRIRLGLRLDDVLDPDTRALLLRQGRLMLAADPQALRQFEGSPAGAALLRGVGDGR